MAAIVRRMSSSKPQAPEKSEVQKVMQVKFKELEQAGKAERLDLAMKRGPCAAAVARSHCTHAPRRPAACPHPMCVCRSGSFGIDLAHYEHLCNVITDTDPDAPNELKKFDVIIAVGEFSLINERIDTHIPPGDQVPVTIFRTSPKEIDELVKLFSKKSPERRRGSVKTPKETMKTGAVLGPGLASSLQVPVDGPASATPGAQEGLASPATPGSDASAETTPVQPGVTKNLGAVTRARKASVERGVRSLSIEGESPSGSVASSGAATSPRSP